MSYYNQWVCIEWCLPYHVGQIYLFHEDQAPPSEKHFKLIVDENDFPIKVRVRT